MLIVPAIDLLDGRCVQLQQGDFERARRYGGDAAAVAARFEQQGALWIHVVDLDAARGGGANREVIGGIRTAVGVRVQVGGGVRTVRDAEALLDLGVDAVVVGTTLAARTAEVLAWAERWPGRVIGGVDARGGQVQVRGWSESAGGERALAGALRGSQLAGLIYTAVDRDGMLGGPDRAGGRAAADASGLPVLLSGGIGSQADLQAVAADGAAVGAIVGTAIYERRVDLGTAIEALQRAEDAARWAARPAYRACPAPPTDAGERGRITAPAGAAVPARRPPPR